ncbi:haloacid dehalogenase type II [Oryzifoliimicrobium ureilyticus]|uniref:haloacid dehalogenase type II n=1 Tax=Oryzifoliimicrobium ureilyticus TaxID=3113724 RepID=UPI0030762ADB
MPEFTTPAFQLAPAPKIITFDCYGALVQWYEVLLREIQRVLVAHGITGVDASAILDTFSAEGRRLTGQKPHCLYKEILQTGFTTAFNNHGIRPSEEEIAQIASAPRMMGPHPEVPDALKRLQGRYKLAIFTNSDDDLIAPTVERIGVPFDYVITAEQAQAYKPSRQLFEYGYRKMDVAPEETVHVAMGMYWDMKARHELGLRGIWVNRRGEEGIPDWLPYAEVGNLTEAADLLLGGSDGKTQ